MSTQNTGGPAFPVVQGCGNDRGMTLLDWFASHASEEDIKFWMPKGYNEEYVIEYPNGDKKIGHRSASFTREQARYRYAAAMLEARK